MEIDIDAGVPLEHISSPYHPILVGDRRAWRMIKLRNQQSPPDRDFEN